MSDQDRRVGKIEGRQEMILEWVSSLQDDHRDLKRRLSREGVLDYQDELSDLEDRFDTLRQRVEKDARVTASQQIAPPAFWDISGVLDFFRWISDSYGRALIVLAFLCILFAIIYFLGWEESIGVSGDVYFVGSLSHGDLLFRRIKKSVQK